MGEQSVVLVVANIFKMRCYLLVIETPDRFNWNLTRIWLIYPGV